VREVEWERARLFPVSGIGGADEQERRASSALLAVIQSVREFGHAITAPMGAPTGRLSAFIEVPFDDQLSRELGTGVRPMVPQAQLRDPAKYLQAAVSDFASTGLLQGAVRVPGAVAPIKITADLRAGLIHCAATVPAPREGRPTTRVRPDEPISADDLVESDGNRYHDGPGRILVSDTPGAAG
jgi:hypothetical protein